MHTTPKGPLIRKAPWRDTIEEMAKLIGTAGHVDHGKTTLIQALTGIDTDRLPEEKRRGMTIDLGFAYLDIPRHGRVSIVDVPGHERFVTNMLAGALGVDLALLCVAADEGVMQQTREHFQILELLPVAHLVVAMTRADLADDDIREACCAEIEDLLEGTRFAGAPIIPVSAKTGEGVAALIEHLDAGLAGGSDKDSGAWYLPIDRVFTVKGRGTVVTGTLARGSVSNGGRAVILPGGNEVRVRGIHSHGTPLERAEPGMRVALNLSGPKLEEIFRGQAICEPGSMFETNQMDIRVRWISVPKHGLRVRVAIGTADSIGRVFLSDAAPDVAQLRLEGMVACALGQPVIVRRYSPPDLLGGGEVMIPHATTRKKSEAPPTEGQAGSEELAILAALEGKGDGMPTAEICRRLGKTPQDLGDVFEKLSAAGSIKGFAGLWFDADAFGVSTARFVTALNELHQHAPLVAYQPREKVVSRAGFSWAGKPLDRIIATMAEVGQIEANGTAVKAGGFVIQLTEKQKSFLERVIQSLESEKVNTPTVFDLAKSLGVPVQAIEEILKLGIQAGKIIALGEGVWYTVEQVSAIRTATREKFGPLGFTAAEFRDTFSTTRKYAIPLLEHFDATRFTTRIGDKRMTNPDESKNG